MLHLILAFCYNTNLSMFCRASFTDTYAKHRKPPVVFDLKSEAGLRQFKNAVTDCDEDGNSPFDRIEVTWPFPMLEV